LLFINVAAERYQYLRSIILEIFNSEILIQRVCEAHPDPSSLKLLTPLLTQILDDDLFQSSLIHVNLVIERIFRLSPAVNPLLERLIDTYAKGVVTKPHLIHPLSFDYVHKAFEAKQNFDMEMLVISYYILVLKKHGMPHLQYTQLFSLVPMKALIDQAHILSSLLGSKIIGLLSTTLPEYFKRTTYLLEQELNERTTFLNEAFLNKHLISLDVDFVEYNQVKETMEYLIRKRVGNESTDVLILLPYILDERFHDQNLAQLFVTLWKKYYLSNPEKACTDILTILRKDTLNNMDTETLQNPTQMIQVCNALIHSTYLLELFFQVEII
jgi:hypothetical protein